MKSDSEMLSFIRFVAICFCMFMFLGATAESVMIDESVLFVVGNVTYHTDKEMDFHTISVDSNYIVFNTTRFMVASSNLVTITIGYLGGDVEDAVYGETMLGFDVDGGGGFICFNISGFTEWYDYKIMRDDVLFSSVNVNDSGCVSFRILLGGIGYFQVARIDNFDLDCDGYCTLADVMLVGNHYAERGGAGWVRADVDDDGVVAVLDLVLVSIHCEES